LAGFELRPDMQFPDYMSDSLTGMHYVVQTFVETPIYISYCTNISGFQDIDLLSSGLPINLKQLSVPV